jgi:hypothetical protein
MEKPGQERDIIDQNDFTRVRENRKIYHFWKETWKIFLAFYIKKYRPVALLVPTPYHYKIVYTTLHMKMSKYGVKIVETQSGSRWNFAKNFQNRDERFPSWKQRSPSALPVSSRSL